MNTFDERSPSIAAEPPESEPGAAKSSHSSLAPSTQAWIDRGIAGVKAMHENEEERKRIAKRLS